MSRQAEVEFGQNHEERIARRWLGLQTSVPGACSVLPGPPYADYDFLVLGDYGDVLAYLEVKLRRKDLAVFRDVMCPKRKHDFALRVWASHNLGSYIATEYAGGALVEVDLAKVPSSFRDIRRSDRPNTKPVPHVFYKSNLYKVLANGES